MNQIILLCFIISDTTHILYIKKESLLGKNIKFGRGEGNIRDVGKNITWKKGKEEEISSTIYFRLLLRILSENRH